MLRTVSRILFAATVVAAASASSAFAAKRVALLVGNGSYEHAGKLRNPVNDAKDMAKALEKLGFDVTTGLDLTEDKFTDAIAGFFDKLEGADTALFFYAGHGLQHQSTNYLVPVDARLKNVLQLKGETISLKDIIAQMEAQVPVNLVFLDACRNNPLARALQRSLRSRGRKLTFDRGLARVTSSAKDTLITFAAAPGAIASDGTGRNSPFTAALLKHIATPNLEIEVMLKRVTAEVRKATDSRQEPERLSKLTKEFYFNRESGKPAEPVAKSTPKTDNATEIAFWNSVKDSAEARDLNSYLETYPNGVFRRLAESRLTALARKAPAPPKPVAEPKRPQTTDDVYQQGVAYLYGRGVQENHGAAFKLFLQAARDNHAKAMYATGLLYREGVGVAKDLNEAAAWLRKAVEAGDERATAKLNETLQQIAALQAPSRTTTFEEDTDTFVVQPDEFERFGGFRNRFKRHKRHRQERHRRNDGFRRDGGNRSRFGRNAGGRRFTSSGGGRRGGGSGRRGGGGRGR